MRRLVPTALLIAVVGILAACGGGGGGGGGSSSSGTVPASLPTAVPTSAPTAAPTQAPASSATLTPIAGTIAGQVNAPSGVLAAVARGTRSTCPRRRGGCGCFNIPVQARYLGPVNPTGPTYSDPLAQTTTDANGNYRLTLPSNVNGSYIIIVTVGAPGGLQLSNYLVGDVTLGVTVDIDPATEAALEVIFAYISANNITSLSDSRVAQLVADMESLADNSPIPASASSGVSQYVAAANGNSTIGADLNRLKTAPTTAPAATAPPVVASAGYDGTYSGRATLTGPVPSNNPNATIAIVNGRIVDPSGTLTGQVGAGGAFSGTWTYVLGVNPNTGQTSAGAPPIPITGVISTTSTFTLSGSVGAIGGGTESATLVLRKN